MAANSLTLLLEVGSMPLALNLGELCDCFDNRTLQKWNCASFSTQALRNWKLLLPFSWSHHVGNLRPPCWKGYVDRFWDYLGWKSSLAEPRHHWQGANHVNETLLNLQTNQVTSWKLPSDPSWNHVEQKNHPAEYFLNSWLRKIWDIISGCCFKPLSFR